MGKAKPLQQKPTEQSGARLETIEELAQMWEEFLSRKFKETEREKLRKEFEVLPECQGDELQQEEYDTHTTVQHIKNSKTTVRDDIPTTGSAEIFTSGQGRTIPLPAVKGLKQGGSATKLA